MLLNKYTPRDTKSIIGNRTAVLKLEELIKKNEKPVLVCGPIGCGKSLSIELVAKNMGLELIRSNASDDRSLSGLRNGIKNATGQKSLLHEGKIILIDDLDMVDSTAAIMEIIKDCSYPVILAAENPYSKKLYKIRQKSSVLKFTTLRSDSISKFLRIICENEGINYERTALDQLAKMCGGDIRAAINDVDTIKSENINTSSVRNLGGRDRTENVFNTLKILFKTMDINNVKTAIKNSDKTNDELISWIEWNVTQEYEDIEEIEKAFDYLSKADIFQNRIRKRQSWGLLKYFSDLMAIGVAMSKKSAYRKFTRYSFPSFYPKGSETDIPDGLHISKTRFSEYRPLIEAMSKSN